MTMEELVIAVQVTAEDAQAYVEQAGRTSRTRLMRMLDLFLASETDMKWAAQPRFALEAATLRACEPEESLQLEALMARVDELERKLREGVVVAQQQAVFSLDIADTLQKLALNVLHTMSFIHDDALPFNSIDVLPVLDDHLFILSARFIDILHM